MKGRKLQEEDSGVPLGTRFFDVAVLRNGGSRRDRGERDILYNSDANAYYATVTVTDLSNGKSKDERIYMGY